MTRPRYLGCARAGYYAVDVYDAILVVVSVMGRGVRPVLDDDVLRDNWGQLWPSGAPEQSRRLAAGVRELRTIAGRR